MINSQFFHPRHSAPRRSGEGGCGGVTPPQHTAGTPPPHSHTHPPSSSPPPFAFDLPPCAAAVAAVQAHHPQMACLPCREETTGTVSSHRRTLDKEKKKKKIGKGRWGWGLIIAAVLQSQQWVLTDKSRAEDTRSRAFAQLPLLDIGLAYQGHWVRIDLVIKIPPLPPLPSLR